MFWLIIHNNKPLEAWLFMCLPDIILMDFGTHRQATQVDHFLKDSLLQNYSKISDILKN